MAKRNQCDPKSVFDKARELSRLVRQLSDLDRLRRRIATDDPPATDWHRDKLAERMDGAESLVKQVASLGRDLAQAAKTWGLPGPSAEIESAYLDKRWHNHDVVWDILPAIRRVEGEAAARMGVASNPSREAADFKINVGSFIPGISPADVGQIFPDAPRQLRLPASHYKDIYGIPTSRLRKAAKDGRLTRFGKDKATQYLDANVRALWPEDFLSDNK